MGDEKKMPGIGTGHRKNPCSDDTMMWCLRQLISAVLPWIATVVTAFCSPSGKAGRFLDRLTVMAEGGGDGV
jgi:hypothetical protein